MNTTLLYVLKSILGSVGKQIQWCGKLVMLITTNCRSQLLCIKVIAVTVINWDSVWSFVIWNIHVQGVPKKTSPLIFWITRLKISQFQQFLVYGILGKRATSRLQICPLYLKSVTALPCEIQDLLLPACYRNIIKCYNKEIKVLNKNCTVNEFAVFFTFSCCVIFIVEVYTVLIKVYSVFFRNKWVALKRAGFFEWLWKELVIVIDLDLHYKHEVSK